MPATKNYTCHVDGAQRLAAGSVLDRIRQALGLSSDGELSRELGIGRSTVGAWRAQGRVPYALCVELHLREGLSLDWLLAGSGEMRKVAGEVGEAGARYESVEQRGVDMPAISREGVALVQALAGYLAFQERKFGDKTASDSREQGSSREDAKNK